MRLSVVQWNRGRTGIPIQMSPTANRRMNVPPPTDLTSQADATQASRKPTISRIFGAWMVCCAAVAWGNQAGGIRGSVVSSGGAPVVAAEVRASGVGEAHVTRSGVDGRFDLRDLPVGVYEVRISAASFHAVIIREVRIGAGEEMGLAPMPLEFAPMLDCTDDRGPDYFRVSGLAEMGGVAGVVTNPHGAIADAEVRLYILGTGLAGSTRTDASGFFAFRDLPILSVERWITISAGGFFAEELRRVRVVAGFEAVYAPIGLESCRAGRCQSYLKTIHVMAPCE
ncbi:MAG TPA: carboxypeptidase-like regulatory domain-containing protein [Bryobacteraceae bacterium]|nr:carboxypeptidase-like regulatory domain-containing protein [Bryobacteraceae bacterium]